MTLLTGLLALVQTCFIPGAILSILLVRETRVRELLPAAFALSLVVNWITVFLAVKLGVFSTYYFWFLFVLETSALLYVLANHRKVNGVPLGKTISPLSAVSALSLMAVVLAFLVVLFRVGQVFTQSDAVLSWNRWASVWGQNRIPVDTYYYPQLLPANYSISYVMTGMPGIQFFAFAITLFFLPLACFALYNLARRIDDPRIHLANVFFLFYIIFIGQAAAGYADVPVACMAVFSICLFVQGWVRTRQKPAQAASLIFLSSIVAAGAAATKQAGVFFAVLNLIGIGVWMRKNADVLNFHRILFWAGLLSTHVIIYGLWYFQANYNIRLGLGGSEIAWLTQGIHQGRGYGARLAYAFSNWPQFFVMAALALPALREKNYRWAALAGLVFLTVWALFFSYDRRNFAMGIPFLALASGAAWISVAQRIPKIPVPAGFVDRAISIRGLLVVCCLVLVASALVPDSLLTRLQQAQQRKAAKAEVMLALSDAFKKYGVGKILTNYDLLPYALGIQGQKDKITFVPIAPHPDNATYFSTLVSEARPAYVITRNRLISEDVRLQISRMEQAGSLLHLQSDNKKDYSLYLARSANTP